MLQPARIIHPPLLHRGIPLVAESLALGLHRRRAADGPLLFTKAVALQLQPPLPRAILRLGDKATPVEFCDPLLPRIARLPAALDGLERMTPRLIRRADALPVGLRQPLRHRVRIAGPGDRTSVRAEGGQDDEEASESGFHGARKCRGSPEKARTVKRPGVERPLRLRKRIVTGRKVTADAAYLRESILKPAANVRQGFNNPDVGMPPYEGILSDSQVESIVLYLRSLSAR